MFTSGSFFYGFSAFFDPIATTFGWSKAATAAALSFQRTESGVVGPFVGILVDRYGPRGIMLVGTVATAAGFLLMARIDSLLTFYLTFGLVALGISLSSFITTTTVVSNWFERHRSRAMTIATAGGGLGGIAAPLLVWGISTYGWRIVLDWIALGTLLVGIPTSLVMRRSPEAYGYLPDGREASPGNQVENRMNDAQAKASSDHMTPNSNSGSGSFTLRETLKTSAFWQLTLSMGLAGLAMSVVVVFSIPALESFGISPGAAGLTLLLVSIINVMGRFLLGFLADVVDKRVVLAVTYLLMGLGTIALATVHQWWQIAIFLALYPAGHGGTVPVRMALLADYYGRKSYGTLIGVISTLTAVFGVIGPVFTGFMFDITQSYRLAFVVIGLLVLIAVPMTLIVKQPQIGAPMSTATLAKNP